MDAPVTKSEFEGHIRRIDKRIDEQNGSIQALGLKIDLLSSKFGENNSTFQTVRRDDSASSSVVTAELGLDGPIQADHTITMEQLQAGHIQG